jgi:transcriptional regulator with XRE-family HTH domain
VLSEAEFQKARVALASNLARLRERHGWSQQQTADAIGIDLKHLQKLEYAALNPTLRTLVAAAQALGTSVGRLLARPTMIRQRRGVGRPRRKSVRR